MAPSVRRRTHLGLRGRRHVDRAGAATNWLLGLARLRHLRLFEGRRDRYDRGQWRGALDRCRPDQWISLDRSQRQALLQGRRRRHYFFRLEARPMVSSTSTPCRVARRHDRGDRVRRRCGAGDGRRSRPARERGSGRRGRRPLHAWCAGRSIVISAAALLRNDFDADRDPLSVAAVSNAKNGAVQLDMSNGDIVFTADFGSPASRIRLHGERRPQWVRRPPPCRCASDRQPPRNRRFRDCCRRGSALAAPSGRAASVQ